MKLSTRARYGLKALIDLGLHWKQKPSPFRALQADRIFPDSYLQEQPHGEAQESRSGREHQRCGRRLSSGSTGRGDFVGMS